MARKPFVVMSAFAQFLVVKYPRIITIILRLSVSLTSLHFFFLPNIKFIFTLNLTFVIILGFSIILCKENQTTSLAMILFCSLTK